MGALTPEWRGHMTNDMATTGTDTVARTVAASTIKLAIDTHTQSKQDKLIPGTNITLVDNGDNTTTISSGLPDYISNITELPTSPNFGDIAIITSDGTATGDIQEIYRFNGFNWVLEGFEANIIAYSYYANYPPVNYDIRTLSSEKTAVSGSRYLYQLEFKNVIDGSNYVDIQCKNISIVKLGNFYINNLYTQANDKSVTFDTIDTSILINQMSIECVLTEDVIIEGRKINNIDVSGNQGGLSKSCLIRDIEVDKTSPNFSNSPSTNIHGFIKSEVNDLRELRNINISSYANTSDKIVIVDTVKFSTDYTDNNIAISGNGEDTCGNLTINNVSEINRLYINGFKTIAEYEYDSNDLTKITDIDFSVSESVTTAILDKFLQSFIDGGVENANINMSVNGTTPTQSIVDELETAGNTVNIS